MPMSVALDAYRELGRKLEELIRPQTFPLAVRTIKSADELMPEYRRPLKKQGLQSFVCQNFKIARCYGWTVAVMKEDINCKAARAIYGWDEMTPGYADWTDRFNVGLYAKDLETSRKLGQKLLKMENAFEGLAISPLARTRVAPESVLIYCLPAQAMRLIQGYLYNEGGVLEFTAAGRIGSCHDGVVKVMVTGKPQLVILGNGDRIWGGAQDSEVMFACPGNRLEMLVDGLEATHRAGLRYPIPSYMNYSPGFQESFENRTKQRAGGTIVKE
jgi:uncharacterized protein (DUF169 family)